MGEERTVESRVAPPPLSCPKCNGLLPNELGEVRCTLCHARVRIDHPITRKKWSEEKVACPDCEKVLVVGVNKRPAHLKCATCSCHFTLVPTVARVEISCPGCDRQLRMKRRPGERQIECPACDTTFKVTF